MIIDTHCHIYGSEMENAEQIIKDAAKNDICVILNGTDPLSNNEILELVDKYENVYGALGYFIAPIDIVPDILPLVGLSDDIAVLAWAFSRVKHNVTDLTREKAKTKLKIWFGDFDEREIDNL